MIARMRMGRRIIGWLWIASVAISAVVFVAAIAMWVRSNRYWDFVYYAYQSGNSEYFTGVGFVEGAITVGNGVTINGPDLSFVQPLGFHFRSYPLNSWRRVELDSSFAGFGFEWSVQIVGSVVVRTRAIAAPLWFVAGVSAVMPLIAFRRWRKKRRIAREGLCPICGYDLRASVERCPECGTAIERGIS